MLNPSTETRSIRTPSPLIWMPAACGLALGVKITRPLLPRIRTLFALITSPVMVHPVLCASIVSPLIRMYSPFVLKVWPFNWLQLYSTPEPVLGMRQSGITSSRQLRCGAGVGVAACAGSKASSNTPASASVMFASRLANMWRLLDAAAQLTMKSWTAVRGDKLLIMVLLGQARCAVFDARTGLRR